MTSLLCLQTVKQVVEVFRNIPALVKRARSFSKMSEDCLFLNVFTPASAVRAKDAGH